MSQDGLRDAIRQAREKQKQRKKQKQVVFRAPKENPKLSRREDGEPTTEALEKWTSEEYLAEFTAQAKASVPGYTKGVAIHEVKAVKEFLGVLDDACPRSKLRIIREAARRLIKYKKDWGLRTAPGAWWLRTHAIAITEDLSHLVYNEASLRYLLSEDVPSDMLGLRKSGETWIFEWEGEEVQIHESQLSTVTNPSLLKQLNIAPEERPSDNENHRGW
jgi:hypothetical protein